MIVVANTEDLMARGVITQHAAEDMHQQARHLMVQMAVNAVLGFGILAATGGLIFLLADAMAVAVVGTLLLAGGLVMLIRAGALFAMFGNAASLIGAGMLIGGAGLELTANYPDLAAWFMIPGGALAAGIAGRALIQGGVTTRFVQGAIVLMGVALHLWGIGFALELGEIGGWAKALTYLYATILIAGAGWLTDVRLVTALAIVPFAQVLDTGTGYFHAAYVFYSPESTLTILQMLALMLGVTLWMRTRAERGARHGRILRLMAFVVANLSALVGSLWGDRVGETVWGPGARYRSSDWPDYAAYQDAKQAFADSAIYISDHVYGILWAIALAGTVFWAAHKTQRGLFNGAVTFAAIHAYTQLFETFGDEPAAWVVGGFGAVALAWGMWRLNQRMFTNQDKTKGTDNDR